MAKFNLITVGSCGIDIFLNIHEANEKLKVNKDELIIKSGEKIMLDGYKFSLGHNGANVSAGASRLGLKTTIFAEVGSDDFSERILNSLIAEKIDISNVLRKPGDSNFSVVVSFQRERTVFSENVKRDHNFYFGNFSSDFLYLTSLSRNWINAYLETMDFVAKRNIPFAFNPGTIQIEDKDKVVFEVIKRSKILFINKEEAEDLLSKKRSLRDFNEKSYMKSLLSEFRSVGASTTVITDAQNGSYCLDEKGKYYFLNGYSTNIVEKTGAGDAYAAGFIYAIIKNLGIDQAMKYGAINAACVMEQIGPIEGLLTSAILKEKVRQLTNFKPIQI